MSAGTLKYWDRHGGSVCLPTGIPLLGKIQRVEGIQARMRRHIMLMVEANPGLSDAGSLTG